MSGENVVLADKLRLLASDHGGLLDQRGYFQPADSSAASEKSLHNYLLKIHISQIVNEPGLSLLPLLQLEFFVFFQLPILQIKTVNVHFFSSFIFVFSSKSQRSQHLTGILISL